MRRPGFVARLALICAAAVLQMTGQAAAEITNVVVKDSGLMGVFGGRQYTWVSADMEGTVDREDGTTGGYRVPVSLFYPDRDSNGFGFVDVVNTIDFEVYTDETHPLGKRQVGYIGNLIFSDFLRTEGFTYISVQWSRMVTELLGPDYGIIENGLDGNQIIRDAARLLRQPENLQGALPYELEGVERVIGHGMSQSASLMREFWRSQNRDEEGSLVFDGILLTGTTAGNCRVLNNDDTPQNVPGSPSVAVFYAIAPCPASFPDEGKIIVLRTQTEGERFDLRLSRYELPFYRVYELAGVSHIPMFVEGLSFYGAPRQNTLSWQPVAKALLRHMVDWIVLGREPPPQLYLDVVTGEDGRFRLATDADGNAVGGVRLPHMPSVLANGERVGAPLGVYGGLDRDLDPALYGYANLGGTFEPFSAEELALRYPSRAAYVDLVRKAADALLSGGYILQEDRDLYVRLAEQKRW